MNNLKHQPRTIVWDDHKPTHSKVVTTSVGYLTEDAEKNFAEIHVRWRSGNETYYNGYFDLISPIRKMFPEITGETLEECKAKMQQAFNEYATRTFNELFELVPFEAVAVFESPKS